MSCNCNHTTDDGNFSCPCDRFIHPPLLRIGAGLSELPRQIAVFNDFRRAMLRDIPAYTPLKDWKARKPGDLGVMLLEMWAYVGDTLCFYDKVISQESYLRTAVRRPSVRKLIALLGYLPAPAIASIAYLAATAEGRIPVKIPAGTAFRSGAFDGNPPQVFELDIETIIHPLTNKWTIISSPERSSGNANTTDFLLLPGRQIKPGTPALVLDINGGTYNNPIWISDSQLIKGSDGRTLNRVRSSQPTTLPANYPLTQLKFLVPTRSASLWTLSGTALSCDGDKGYLALDNVYHDIRKGEYIVLTKGSETRWFIVEGASQQLHQQNTVNSVTINGTPIPVPNVSVPVTILRLDKCFNNAERRHGGVEWINGDAPEITVHYALEETGPLTAEPNSTVRLNETLFLQERPQQPVDDYSAVKFLLNDINTRAAMTGGMIDYTTGTFHADQPPSTTNAFTVPVELFGNVLQTSRGETVKDEILGSGNAAQINQTFILKKNPLTYLPAASRDGTIKVSSTLVIYVNDIRWREAPSFYNRKHDEPIYIVRQNDQGETQVTFGDGIRGLRLPTGVDNIRANYRFGAGAAVPPAGSINQIGTPVKGLQKVNNVLPAGGGKDAEGTEGIRTFAPRSVLMLGRAVSLTDIEALVTNIAGVIVVQVEWRWHPDLQCPLVHIWYRGNGIVSSDLLKQVRAYTDPTLIIAAEPANPISSTISIEVKIDPTYITDKVIRNIMSVLTDTNNGILSPYVLGIGRPLFRSQVFAAVLSVEGVQSVRNILVNNQVFSSFNLDPQPGNYFDFAASQIIITETQQL